MHLASFVALRRSFPPMNYQQQLNLKELQRPLLMDNKVVITRKICWGCEEERGPRGGGRGGSVSLYRVN